jgi:hypothetical protein
MKDWLTKRWAGPLGLAAVLIIAVLLRLPGFDRAPQLGFGPLYQDELKMFTNTVSVMKGKALLPHWPYGIYRIMEPQFQTLRAWYTLECGRSLPLLSPSELRRIAEANLDHVFLMIRAHALFFGLGIIVLTYVIGRRIAAVPGGLAAALIVAIAPLMVSYSRMMYYDIVMVFFFLLYVLVFAKALRERSVGYTYAAVALSAVAFTMKQNAVVLFAADLWLVSAVIAHWRPWRLLYSRHSLWLALMTLAVLWYGYPTMFTLHGLGGFVDSVSSKYYETATAEPAPIEARLWWLWVRSVWVEQAPPAVLLVLLLGLVAGLFAARDRHVAASVFGLGLLYYFVGGYSTHAIDRTFLPLLPLFALGMAGWIALLRRAPSPWLRVGVPAALLLFAAVPLLQNTLRVNLLLTLPDTRQDVVRWLEANAADSAHVARETYAPQLPRLRPVDCPAGLETVVGGEKHFRITYRNSLASEPPDWWSQQGIRYLIHVRANYDRLLRQRAEGHVESPTDTSARRMGKTPRYGAPIAEAIGRYNALAARYPVAARFTVARPPDWLMGPCAVYRYGRDRPEDPFPHERECVGASLSSAAGIAEFLFTRWLDPDVVTLWRNRDRYMLGRDVLIYDTGANGA